MSARRGTEGSTGEPGAGSRPPPKASKYANLRHGEIARGVGVEPVRELVDRLTAAYGSIALFFYDGLGGRCIALKWRPSAFLPGPLKVGSAQHRMLVGSGEDGEATAKAWALPNIADVLAGMVQAGDGLIVAARLPQSSHAFGGGPD